VQLRIRSSLERLSHAMQTAAKSSLKPLPCPAACVWPSTVVCEHCHTVSLRPRCVTAAWSWESARR